MAAFRILSAMRKAAPGDGTMKLRDNIDIIAFLKSVKECRRDVYYDSPEGDHLDLKSALSQYVLSASSHDRYLLQNGVVVCDDMNDYERLREFLIG